MMSLFAQFLRQNMSTIKVSDKNGFHFSDLTNMRRGCQQGGIGSDVVFAMINEGFTPIGNKSCTIIRKKFVDDFEVEFTL